MVTFPGLNLSFDISPIATTVLGVDIYFYAICIVFGILFAVILSYISKEKFGIQYNFLFESLMYAIIIGLIGSRAYYLIFNIENYITTPLKILNLRDGGMAIYGGLIAGAIYLIKRCKKYKINILNFFDYLVPFIALAQSIGRWGNFFNIEAYGTQTTNIFRMGIITEQGYQEVHPTFLYESLGTFMIFLVLRMLQKDRRFKGEICYMYLFLYSGLRTIVEGVRIDSLMFVNLRISQVLSIAIFVVSGIMLLKNNIKYISKKNKLRK